MKVPLKEFNDFWNEILGDDWYIGDEDYDEDEHEGVVLIGEFIVAYQGKGNAERPKHVNKSEMDTRVITTGLLTLFERWRKAKTHTDVVAYFSVPHEKLSELKKEIGRLGGSVISE